MNELIEHIRKMNEEGRERMAKDPNVWVGMITEDPQHWADYGITTVEQFGDYLDACVQKEYDSDNVVEEDPAHWIENEDGSGYWSDGWQTYEPDHPYIQECRRETTGDEMSKQDYMDMYDLEDDR